MVGHDIHHFLWNYLDTSQSSHLKQIYSIFLSEIKGFLDQLIHIRCDIL